MKQRKNIEVELERIGITTQKQLNSAIRKIKPVNLSLMAGEQKGAKRE